MTISPEHDAPVTDTTRTRTRVPGPTPQYIEELQGGVVDEHALIHNITEFRPATCVMGHVLIDKAQLKSVCSSCGSSMCVSCIHRYCADQNDLRPLCTRCARPTFTEGRFLCPTHEKEWWDGVIALIVVVVLALVVVAAAVHFHML